MDKLDLDAIEAALKVADRKTDAFEGAWAALARLRAALPVEEQGPRPVDLELMGEKLKELLDATLEDFLVQSDIDELRHAVTEVVILALRASRPLEEGKAEPRPGGLRSIEQATPRRVTQEIPDDGGEDGRE